MSRIVVHPGGAHLDDLLAVALALALDPAVDRIERRLPTEEELADPAVWVLDQGRRLEPDLRNFDHHQFADGVPDCTFSLIAEHFGLNPWLSDNLWYEPARLLDSLGAHRAAERLGTDARMVGAIYTPADEYFITRLAAERDFGPVHPLFGMLRGLGRDMTTGVRRMKERQVLLAEKSEFVTVKGLRALLFLEPVPDGTFGICRYLRDHGGAAVSVTADSRGEGWSLQRLEEHPRVDFRRVAERDGVFFVHNTGFVAKVRDLGRPFILSLLHDAIDGPADGPPGGPVAAGG